MESIDSMECMESMESMESMTSEVKYIRWWYHASADFPDADQGGIMLAKSRIALELKICQILGLNIKSLDLDSQVLNLDFQILDFELNSGFGGPNPDSGEQKQDLTSQFKIFGRPRPGFAIPKRGFEFQILDVVCQN